MEDYLKITLSIVYALAWYGFYKIIDHWLILDLNPLKLIDTKSRTVAGIHGVISTALFVAAFVIQSPSQLNNQNSTFSNGLLIFTFGYFIFHTLLSAYYTCLQYHLLLTHHVICLMGLFFTLFFEKQKIYCLLAIFIGEFSNPFMNAKFIIINLNLKYTKIYHFFEAIFIFNFLVARVIILPISVYYAMTSPLTGFYFKVATILFLIFSINLTRSLIPVIFKNIRRTKERQQKDIQYQWFSQNQEELRKLSYFEEEILL